MASFFDLDPKHFSTWILGAVVAALVAHHAIFRHGEWHLHGVKIVLAHGSLALSVAALQNRIFDYSLPDTILRTVALTIWYTTSLFTSIFVYRLLFHPLRKFPGPFTAKFTKFWHVWKCRDARNHRVMVEMHDKYGEFVRTGPSELAITHPEVHKVIDGLGSTCGKAPWYDNLWPSLSVVSCRDRKSHDERRKVWDQGFSNKLLLQYEARVLRYVEQVESLVANSNGVPVNVSNVFYWFGWDVMGSIIFAKDFGMLESQEWHIAIFMLRKAMKTLGLITPVPWLGHLAFGFLPFLSLIRSWFDMLKFCHHRMNERIEMKDAPPDVSSPLINEARKNGFTDLDWRWLHGDAVLAVLAGSDTAAATLVFGFYRLAQYPEQQQKLYDEIKSVDVHDARALQHCAHLNAIINETLRLHPVLPTGGLRQTPPEGTIIGGRFIPGHTTIIAPRAITSRLESCYEQPNEFVPERWTTRPEMIRDKSTFVPFGLGRFNCVGKNLGLAELRLVISTLVKKYTVEFKQGDDGSTLINDMRDTFTPSPGDLNLVYKSR